MNIKIHHRTLRYVFAFIFLHFFIVKAAYGQECSVSTDVRRVMLQDVQLQSEKLNEATGQYSAVLINGDILLARFSTCDLGVNAHYYTASEYSDSELKQRVEILLKGVLASKAVADKVMPQLKDIEVTQFERPVILNGLDDQHEVLIKHSGSPIFEKHIQYTWVPPEY